MKFTKDPSETELFTFDYVNMLAPGETISSASVTNSLVSGTDPSPEDMVSGSSLIDSPRVAQMITGGNDGAEYHLKCTANTSLGQSLVICVDLEVEAC